MKSGMKKQEPRLFNHGTIGNTICFKMVCSEIPLLVDEAHTALSNALADIGNIKKMTAIHVGPIGKDQVLMATLEGGQGVVIVITKNKD